jgi:hypothetical protein
MYIGTVISKKDVTGKGCLTVCPKGLDCDDNNNWREVKYVSFYSGKFSGASFIPETNTDILYDIAKNDEEHHYYYIGSVQNPSIDTNQEQALFPSDRNPALGGENTNPADPNDGAENDQSMSYGIATPLGHHLLLKDNRSSEADNTGAKLGSARGHGLFLDDAANTQKVNLFSKDQAATLKLTDINSEDAEIGPEGAMLRAVRNLILESKEGDMIFRVKDGRNLKIVNSSTGSHSGNLLYDKFDACNIEIISDRGDILIQNHGNGVFIDCLGGTQANGSTGSSFQVRSNNKIHLYAQNGIDLKSPGDINISGKNVNIQSDITQGGKVQLNPYQDKAILDGNSIGIRKTNTEITYELVYSLYPFFNDEQWTINYTSGPNTDPRLTGTTMDSASSNFGGPGEPYI